MELSKMESQKRIDWAIVFIVVGTMFAIIMAWRGDSQGIAIQRKIDSCIEKTDEIIRMQDDILRSLNKMK